MDATHFKQTSLPHQQAGSTMMETVVALFVLAIGLLGTLAMQANGVNSNQRANLVTEANLLAADMVDRILAFNDIDSSADDDAYDGIDTSSGTASLPDCSSGCTATQQIAYDEAQWAEQLATTLPGGVGKITFDSTTNAYTIQVMWDHNRNGATGTGCTGNDWGESATELTCYTYELRL
ncbi:type IV pilus modification protein PilV [Teredinibacter turnerae]|uniref:type IV pilus modification protein PilV n=1 Tax=Teredinibacter turnerae TaxID=2426 RepID=UPI000426EE3A|nr:type IV pilus modification protein PilV [Teredinibacter turnerae]